MNLNELIKEYDFEQYLSKEPIDAGVIVNDYVFEIGKYEDHSAIMNGLKRCNDIKYIISYRLSGRKNEEANIRFFGKPSFVGIKILIKWLYKVKPECIFFDFYTIDGKLIESKEFDSLFDFFDWIGYS